MPTPAPPPITTATLADQAFDILLDRIAAREYPPGHVLTELDLVAQLGVSRTPIREALLRLSEYGLVSLKGRSARVREITADEVTHIYQAREVLEVGAVGLACGRLTPADFAELDALTPHPAALDEPAGARLDRRLHLLIAERSGNPILWYEIRKLLDLIRLAHKQLADDRDWLTREFEEHTAIIAALRSGDRAAARRALRRHLRSACRTNVRCARAAAGRPAPVPGGSSSPPS
ncbi:MAG: GntR family transcriptional regulator [Isosphaera sp.]|nr:GntR family transcriptional regulator [Isosphaera sp.]